jgi:hypothetical protein
MNYTNLSTKTDSIYNSNYKVLPNDNFLKKDYSKNLLSNASYSSNISNTVSIGNISNIEKYKKKIIEKNFSSDFDIFKEKFENFLRFEDIPIEYVSPIEKEFVKFLKLHKVQTLNLVCQWIIDSFDNPKTLLNIVKILGNVAVEFLDGQLISNLFILLNHRDTEIKEYVLRIQEKLLDQTFHNLLSNSHLAPKWIDDYRKELIEMYKDEKAVEE